MSKQSATHIPGPPPAGERTSFAFLGPFGTFTVLAVWKVAPAGADLLPVSSAGLALDMVRQGEADRAVVPIENSIEGGVNATIDALSRDGNLMIVAEMLIPIRFFLAAPEGMELDQVTRIGTHPHAWAQCREWVRENLPNAIHVPTTSTAAGAEILSGADPKADGLTLDAALCNETSVSRYGLTALARDVADNPDAVTRFVMVSRIGKVPPPTGADKTTIQVKLPSDKSGSLLTMLEQFSARGVNLSRIESRPSGDGLGHYAFSIDIAGHISEERVQAALSGLHRTCPQVLFLGSYPRVDGERAKIRKGTSDEDFVAARNWVQDLVS